MKRLTRPKILIPFAVILTGLLIGGLAMARKGDGPRGPDGPRAEFNLRMLERASGQLGLDDGTLTRIKDRVYESEKVGIELKAKLELAKLELRRILGEDNPPRDTAMQRIAAVGALETQLRQHQIGLMIDVRAMLTAEQRTLLKQMRSERRAKRGKRGKRGERGERGRRGPPPPDAPDAPPGAFD